MKKSLQYIVLALACWAVVIYCFTVVAPWTTAVSISDLGSDFRAKADERWRSAIVEHGKVEEWSRGTIEMNPAGFWGHVSALSVFGIVGVLFAMKADKARKTEQGDGGNSAAHHVSL